jgi:hypothetical protein
VRDELQATLHELREQLRTKEQSVRDELQGVVDAAKNQLTDLQGAIKVQVGARLEELASNRVPPLHNMVGLPARGDDDTVQLIAAAGEVLTRLHQEWRKREPDPGLTQALDKLAEDVPRNLPNYLDRYVPNQLIEHCRGFLAGQSRTGDEARARESLVQGLIAKVRELYQLK